MLTARSQRGRDRRSHYVDNLSVIDRRDYTVDVIGPRVARGFIAGHHYLPGYPAAQLAVGLFGPRSANGTRLAGVAVFAVPTIGAVISRHSGLEPARGCVLSRFVLLDEVAGNGESFFLARALRHLRREKPGIEAVISYADPAAGHVGQVYAALSGAYRGQMPSRTRYIAGTTAISGRTLSKIRLGERGAGGAVDQLVRAGVPKPQHGETLPAWLHRLGRERLLLRAQTPGLHAYCFELSRRARHAGQTLARRPYPKIIDQPHPELAFGHAE